MNFNTSISNVNQYCASSLWQAAEDYLHVGQKAYEITARDETTLTVKESPRKQNVIVTALKVFSYCTLPLLAIAALIVKATYRNRYTINIASSAKPQNDPVSESKPTLPKEIKKIAAKIVEKPLNTPNDPLPETKQEPIPVLPKTEEVKKEPVEISEPPKPSTTETIDHQPQPETSDEYDLFEVIRKIRSLVGTTKLGLFAGRRDDQSIPKEEGWTWVSLDELMVNKPDPNRLHLQMSFMSLKRLTGVFNKIVVDCSVLKFISPIYLWRKDTSLWTPFLGALAKDKDSELITEIFGSNPTYQGSTTVYEPKGGTLTLPVSMRGNKIEIEKHKKILIEKIRTECLEPLFEHVELKTDFYPYLDKNEPYGNKPQDFWVLRSPKVRPK